MFYKKLTAAIAQTESRVCVGLDADLSKLPSHLPKTPEGVFEFNQQIIEATKDIVSAYKINTAFYEAMGKDGWALLERIVSCIPQHIITIADAKRGDIGNTSAKYAEAFFAAFPFDSVTLSPYMGFDSIEPFLAYPEKGSIVLCLTSNAGSSDFQKRRLESGIYLYECVAETVNRWHEKHQNCMLVVGATHNAELEKIRAITPAMYFLVPGIGAQGGDLETVLNYCGEKVLINVSRSVIYAASDESFAAAAKDSAAKLNTDIRRILNKG